MMQAGGGHKTKDVFLYNKSHLRINTPMPSAEAEKPLLFAGMPLLRGVALYCLHIKFQTNGQQLCLPVAHLAIADDKLQRFDNK